MGFAVIVPARLASRRLPDKPLADIGGKPMIAHVLGQAAAAGAERVAAATDSPAVAQAAKDAGFEAVITGECANGTERAAAAAAKLKLTGTVINLQGDEPFIAPATIAAVAERAAQAQWCATAASLQPAASCAGTSIVRVAVSKQGQALYFSREAIPHSAAEQHAHIGIYGFRSAAALAELAALAPCAIEQAERLEQLRWLWNGYAIEVAVVDEFNCGIDTPEELERARQHYASLHGSERAGA